MTMIESYFLWFILYSIVGWIYETILCSVQHRRFINRGFLNGPYCPIYGCGAILDILLLGEIENPVLLFFAAALLTSTLEYLTSWGMELLFNARWWDYSDKKFNINGRVYLTGAIAFGTFSLTLLKAVHPAVAAYTETIQPDVRSIVALVLFTALLSDTVFTITRFSEFNEVLRDMADTIDNTMQSAKIMYGRVGTSCRWQLRKINSQIRRMLLSFPMLESTRYNKSLKKLRELIQNSRGGDKRQ